MRQIVHPDGTVSHSEDFNYVPFTRFMEKSHSNASDLSLATANFEYFCSKEGKGIYDPDKLVLAHKGIGGMGHEIIWFMKDRNEFRNVLGTCLKPSEQIFSVYLVSLTASPLILT